MICNNCGKNLPDDMRFCKYCGAKVLSGAPNNEIATEEVKTAADNVDAESLSIAPSELQEAQPSFLKQLIKRKRNRWIIIVGAGVLLITVALILVFSLRAEILPAGNFSDGYAKVKKNDLYGYIDTTGTVVIPIKYSKAGDFYAGYANVEVPDENNTYFRAVIDKQGHEVFNYKDYESQYTQMFDSSEGLIIVSKRMQNFDTNETQYGIMDLSGTLVCPLQTQWFVQPPYGEEYYEISFMDGFVWMHSNDGPVIINQAGEIVASGDYFDSNFSKATIDHSGFAVLTTEHDVIDDENNNNLDVAYTNTGSQSIVSGENHTIYYFNGDILHLLFSTHDYNADYIYASFSYGEEIVGIHTLFYNSESDYPMAEETMFLRKDGTSISLPDYAYSSLGSFYDGVAPVSFEGKDGQIYYSYTDIAGNFVLEPTQTYEYGEFGPDGYAWWKDTSQNGHAIKVDRNFKTVDSSDNFSDAEYSEGFCYNTGSDKYELLDVYGNALRITEYTSNVPEISNPQDKFNVQTNASEASLTEIVQSSIPSSPSATPSKTPTPAPALKPTPTPTYDQYIGTWVDQNNTDENSVLVNGGYVLNILSINNNEVSFALHLESGGGDRSRLASIEAAATIEGNTASFTFDNDNWDNAGIGAINLLQDTISISLEITEPTDMANFDIGHGATFKKISDDTTITTWEATPEEMIKYRKILPSADSWEYGRDGILNELELWTEAGYTLAEALRLARNELYANHGLVFEAPELTQYFYDERPEIYWQNTTIDSDYIHDVLFNGYELANHETIQQLERELDGSALIEGLYMCDAHDYQYELFTIYQGYVTFWFSTIDYEEGIAGQSYKILSDNRGTYVLNESGFRTDIVQESDTIISYYDGIYYLEYHK